MKFKIKYIVLISIVAAISVYAFWSFRPVKFATPRILIIHSFAPEYENYKEFNKVIISEFKKHRIKPDARFIYLNCASYLEEPELRHMSKSLDSVTSDGWRPDIIMVHNDQATYSLLKCGHPLVRQIPVVFSGVNYPNWKLIREYPNVTGLEDKIDLKSNIKFICRVMHKNMSVYVNIDSTFIDKKLIGDFKQQLKGTKIGGVFSMPDKSFVESWLFSQKHKYPFFDAFPMRMYGDSISTFWPQVRVYAYNPTYWATVRTLGWPLNHYREGISYLVTKYDMSDWIINICINPIFSAVDLYFGHQGKVVGGYMSSIKIIGKEEVNIADKILNGVNVSKIPITRSEKEYVVDWQAMKLYNISIDSLPDNCRLINEPIHDRFLLFIIIFAIVVTFALVLSTFLYLKERSRRRKLKNDLYQETNLLSLALRGGKTFAWSFSDGEFSFDNSFWTFLNATPHKIKNEDMSSYVHPDYLNKYLEAVSNALNSNTGIVQLPFKMVSSEYVWWETRYMLAKNANGKDVAYGLAINIEKIKEHEIELDNLRKQAEKAELKQSFIENINHEIRTPLNAIVGFAGVLASEDNLTQEEKQSYINIVNTNNDKLLKMIDGILMISKFDSHEIIYERKDFEVKGVMTSLYDSFKSMASTHLQFILEEDLASRYILKVDKNYFLKVFEALLENAFKFTKEGYVKLGYHYHQDKSALEVYVEDTGCGISEDDLQFIFHPFYKCDRFSEGFGLGLTICNSLLSDSGNSVHVTSQLGKGSRFYIFLNCTALSL